MAPTTSGTRWTHGVFAASGDPVDAVGPDGKTAFPRGGSRSVEDQLTPDAIKRSGDRFEPIKVDREWVRRRDDLEVDATVLLTPSNPEPVSVSEYQSIEKSYGAGGGINKSDSTSSSVGVEVSDTVVPVTAAAGSGGTMVRFRGLFGAEITPVDLRWGAGKGNDFGGSTETTVTSSKVVKETLVWTDVRADVVAEARYEGNFDRAKWVDGKEPGRSGVSFDLPRSMLMWATDEQIRAMRETGRSGAGAVLPAETVTWPGSQRRCQHPRPS